MLIDEKTYTHRIDQDDLVMRGMRKAKRIGVNTRIAVLRAYLHGSSPVWALRLELMELEQLIADAMLAGHLSGRLRAILTAASHYGKTVLAFGPYDSAISFIQRRLGLDSVGLARLKKQYGDTATDVTRNMSAAVERKVQQAVNDITVEGMHVRDGVKRLRKAMTAAGIEADNPWLLETLVRTQTQMAYSAGRWNANQDPDIQQILWGYVYVTAGDDRVRPNHEDLDGVELPKEDTRWSEIWPPNGFNCRCDVIEIFKDEKHKVVEVPEGGGADKNWAVNHGQIYEDTLAGRVPIRKVVEPPTVVKPIPLPRRKIPTIGTNKLLTEGEKKLIGDYSVLKYPGEITYKSWEALSSASKEYATKLENALLKMPARPVTVFRGIRFKDKNTLDNFLQQLKFGDTYITRGIQGATSDIELAEMFTAGEHSVMLKIRGKTLREITKYSQAIEVGEREFIFLREVAFKVTEVGKYKGVPYIEMTEVL